MTSYRIEGWQAGEDPHWRTEGSYQNWGDAYTACCALIGRYDAVRLVETVWSFGEPQ